MTPELPSAGSTPDAPRPADPVARALRAWTVLTLLALIALGLAWELWLAPTGSGTLAVKVVPLALCLGGLLRHRMYTFRWLSLLLWLYFGEGVLRATTESGLSMWLAIAEIVLSLVLFGLSAAYIRWRLRQASAVAEAARDAATA